MTYIQPHLINSHAPLISAGTPRPRREAAPAPSEEYKITGDDYSQKPDKESQWDPWTHQWRRKWLPGEKEAEVQQRVGDVKLAQHEQLYDYQLSSKQKTELQQINDALEEARRSGRYSPEEMVELERQADAQRMGIKPLPSPKDEPMKPNIQVDADGRKWIQNGNKWDPVEDQTKEKRLTLNDVLKNVPTERRADNPSDPDVILSMDERLDMAQKILDRIYPPERPAAPQTPAGMDPFLAARLGVTPFAGQATADAMAAYPQYLQQLAAQPPAAPQTPAPTEAPAGTPGKPTPTQKTQSQKTQSQKEDENDEFAAYRRK